MWTNRRGKRTPQAERRSWRLPEPPSSSEGHTSSGCRASLSLPLHWSAAGQIHNYNTSNTFLIKKHSRKFPPVVTLVILLCDFVKYFFWVFSKSSGPPAMANMMLSANRLSWRQSSTAPSKSPVSRACVMSPSASGKKLKPPLCLGKNPVAGVSFINVTSSCPTNKALLEWLLSLLVWDLQPIYNHITAVCFKCMSELFFYKELLFLPLLKEK